VTSALAAPPEFRRTPLAGTTVVPLQAGGVQMIGLVVAVLVAALVYALCVALGLPAIVGIVAAILVLLAGIPSGGYGLGRR